MPPLTWRDGTTTPRTHRDLEDRAQTIDYGVALPTLPDALYGIGSVYVRTADWTLWRSTGTVWNSLTQLQPYSPESGMVQPFPAEYALTNITLAASTFFATQFVATHDATVGNFIVQTDGSFSGFTVGRCALFSVANDLSMTIVGRSALAPSSYSPGAFSVISFSTTGGFPATADLVKDGVYGVGIIQVGASSAPILQGLDFGAVMSNSPRLALLNRSIALTAQSDAPLTVAASPTLGRYVPWIGLV